MGSVMVLLTTILSGNFYAFDKGNEFLEKVIWIFPQKSILSFVQGIEGGRSGLEMVPQLSYPLALTLLFFIVAMIKIKKEYVLREN